MKLDDGISFDAPPLIMLSLEEILLVSYSQRCDDFDVLFVNLGKMKRSIDKGRRSMAKQEKFGFCY